MLPSRRLSITFAAVFLIGIAVGALVMWDLSDVDMTQFMSKTNDPNDVMVKRITDKYVNTYHFTPDEMTRIHPLIVEMAQNVFQVRHDFGVNMLAAFDASHARIAAELTPEHRAVFEKATADRRKQLTVLLLDKNSSTHPSP